MTPRKRKTLPKDFDDLLKSGNTAAIITTLEACEVDARGGYGKEPALSFTLCPEPVTRWLLQHGANLEATDDAGKTPLHSHAGTWNGNVELLLELGASVAAIDQSGNSPLHAAAATHRTGNVRALLGAGADTRLANSRGHTPLAAMLAGCDNNRIRSAVEIAEALLTSGAITTDSMRAEVRRIGEDFERYRDSFAPEKVPDTSDALDQLYVMFDVAPVPQKPRLDPTMLIVTSATRWQDQHEELWSMLVPAQGAAATVQGEVIRITGRLSDEILGNGGVNWGNDYNRMAKALHTHLGSHVPVSPDDLKTVAGTTKTLRGRKRGTADTAQLARIAVTWVQRNPGPVPLPAPDYDR